MCLRPLVQEFGNLPADDVSNPSRGTCAFGQGKWFILDGVLHLSQTPLGERVPSAAKHRYTNRLFAIGLKPLSGNVCLRPLSGTVESPVLVYRLKPLSGNVCLRPRARYRFARATRIRLKPLSGNVCLRPHSLEAAIRAATSSQTPLGERVPSAQNKQSPRIVSARVSNPSRGTCAFGRKSILGGPSLPSRSQTPLGERVPSALNWKFQPLSRSSVSNPSRGTCAFGQTCLALWYHPGARLKPLSGNVCLRPSLATSLRMTSAGSLKPLSGNVCLRPSCHDRSSQNVELSLKPLSGNVCLRPRQGTAKRNRLPVCLKPLSGNVCLRPWDTFNGLLCLPCVSNPSRGTCAFGPQWRKSILGSLSWSQTPLGERVPSALERDDFRREVIEGLKPLSGNVCLRPTLGRGRLRNRASVSNPSRGTCAFGPLSRRRLGFSGAASQTPLGERVPSAGERDPWRSVRGVSNPSRGTCAFGRA